MSEDADRREVVELLGRISDLSLSFLTSKRDNHKYQGWDEVVRAVQRGGWMAEREGLAEGLHRFFVDAVAGTNRRVEAWLNIWEQSAERAELLKFLDERVADAPQRLLQDTLCLMAQIITYSPLSFIILDVLFSHCLPRCMNHNPISIEHVKRIHHAALSGHSEHAIPDLCLAVQLRYASVEYFSLVTRNPRLQQTWAPLVGGLVDVLRFAAAHTSEGVRAVALEAMARCGFTSDLTPDDALCTFVLGHIYSPNPVIRSLATGALGFFTWRPVVQKLSPNMHIAAPPPLLMAFDCFLSGSPRTDAVVPSFGVTPLRLPADIHPGIANFAAQLVPAMSVVVQRLLLLADQGGATDAFQRAIANTGMGLDAVAVHEALIQLFITAPAAGRFHAETTDAFFSILFSPLYIRLPMRAVEIYSLLQTSLAVAAEVGKPGAPPDLHSWRDFALDLLFHLFRLAEQSHDDGFGLNRIIDAHISRGVAVYPDFGETIVQYFPDSFFQRPQTASVLLTVSRALEGVPAAAVFFASKACQVFRQVLATPGSLAPYAVSLRPILLVVPAADNYVEEVITDVARRCAQELRSDTARADLRGSSVSDLLALGALCVQLFYDGNAALDLLRVASEVGDIDVALVIFRTAVDNNVSPVPHLPPFPPNSTSRDHWAAVSQEVVELPHRKLTAVSIGALVASLLFSKAGPKDGRVSLWRAVCDKVAGLEDEVLKAPKTLPDLSQVMEALGCAVSDAAKETAARRWIEEFRGSDRDAIFKKFTQAVGRRKV